MGDPCRWVCLVGRCLHEGIVQYHSSKQLDFQCARPKIGMSGFEFANRTFAGLGRMHYPMTRCITAALAALCSVAASLSFAAVRFDVRAKLRLDSNLTVEALAVPDTDTTLLLAVYPRRDLNESNEIVRSFRTPWRVESLGRSVHQAGNRLAEGLPEAGTEGRHRRW